MCLCFYSAVVDLPINPGSGYDFRVVATQSHTREIMRLTLILNGDGSWTKVKVSYFCSNRNDMWAG
jgi:hypothetical protein